MFIIRSSLFVGRCSLFVLGCPLMCSPFMCSLLLVVCVV